MTDKDRLDMLKIDLGITATRYDDRLVQYLRAAVSEIEQEGCALDLDNSLLANQLVVNYAAWKWRRRDTGEGMPRMVRYALNNLIISQVGEDDG